MPFFDLRIRKRDGTESLFDPTQIRDRILALSQDLFPKDHVRLTELLYLAIIMKLPQNTLESLSTTEIDDLSVNVIRDMGRMIPDCLTLAGRIYVSNLHKQIGTDVVEQVLKLITHADGKVVDILHPKIRLAITKHQDFLRTLYDPALDYTYHIAGLLFSETNGYMTKTTNERGQTHIAETIGAIYLRIVLQEFHQQLQGEMTIEMMQDIRSDYQFMALKIISSATPILLRSGKKGAEGRLSSTVSCILLRPEDSIKGIKMADFLAAVSSAGGGGVGIDLDLIRPNGAYIAGSNGYSKGIVPFVQDYASTAKTIDQGGNRPGSFAVYRSICFQDIRELINFRNEKGKQTLRAHGIFMGVKITPLFIDRAFKGQNWSLFDPRLAPKLGSTFGSEHSVAYLEYEASDLPRVTINARALLEEMASQAFEVGMPYLMHRDYIQIFHNQAGRVMPNLCTEVILAVNNITGEMTENWSAEYGDVAVCNLGAICPVQAVEYRPEFDKCDFGPIRSIGSNGLPTPLFKYDNVVSEFISNRANWPSLFTHDLDEIFLTPHYLDGHNGARLNLLTVGLSAYADALQLNRLIDGMEYPHAAHKVNNDRERPIGIGTQGLFDAMIKCCISPVDLDNPNLPQKTTAEQFVEAVEATKYYFALLASTDLAEKDGAYPAFETSKFAQGKLQFDLRNDYIEEQLKQMHMRNAACSGTELETQTHNSVYLRLVKHTPFVALDWAYLKRRIAAHGTRNATLTCIPPTESTAKRLVNTDMTEPPKSMILAQKNDKINQQVIYPLLLEALAATTGIGKFSIRAIMQMGGSIQGMGIHPDLKSLFRTIFEYDGVTLVKLTAMGEWYTDMARSFTWYFTKPDPVEWMRMLKFASYYGLKCLAYYTRVQPAKSMQIGRKVTQDVVNSSDQSCLLCSA